MRSVREHTFDLQCAGIMLGLSLIGSCCWAIVKAFRSDTEWPM